MYLILKNVILFYRVFEIYLLILVAFTPIPFFYPPLFVGSIRKIYVQFIEGTIKLIFQYFNFFV